jgi:anti-sigma B factor antagonist
MPTKSLTIREDSDVIIVDVNSDLGSYEAAELRRGLQELIGQEAEKIIVNLNGVQHINSTAVGALVGIAKRLRQKSGDLKVFGTADHIKRTFDLIGASRVLELYESEASALAGFK